MQELLQIFALLIAHTTVSAEAGPIDEVSTSASRRPASLGESSSALSLASGAAVREGKLTTDALKSLAGVNVQQTTPGQGSVIIRGLKGSAILHLVDGMRLNNAIFRSAPTQYLALVPTVAVERIEVLRGTSTALYGSEAVGGVVQITSRVPTFDSTETSTRREIYASLDTAELQKSIGASIDVGTKKFASSFSAEYLSTGDRRTGGGDRVSPSGFNSKAARVVLVATPTDERSWLFDLQLLEQPKTPRVDELVPGFGQTQPSSSEFFFAPNQRLFAHARHTRANGALGLDWKFDLVWQRIVDDRITRDFEALDRVSESNRSDLAGATVSASGERDNVSWIVGGEAYHDKVHSTRREEDTTTGQSQRVASRFPDGANATRLAIYGSMDRLLSRRHLLRGGLRFSHVDISVPDTDVTASESISANNLSGDLGWVYNVSDSWQFVANLGAGFRAPNVFDLGTLGNRPGNRFNIPNTDLDSEHVLHGDIGIRHGSARRQLSLVLYALRYDDRITSVLTGDLTADGRDVVQSVNAARSHIRGIEAEAVVDLNGVLRLKAMLNYTWGEQRVSGEAREPADRIPPLSGRLALIFDGGKAWTLESWIESAARQDRLSARDLRDVRINPAGSPGWASLGARADWELHDSWQLSLSISNLLDRRYRSHGSGIDQPGRNVSVQARRVW
ncbi:MAG: TonB-dependent receptor [Gammaproteobacteria bacterium]|nr:TonB-dependent receptor [Gammaproteobacteria bacterium]MDH3750164.1 TonB-dependent receptor [Gammaproteobacteria bacterium]MDH3805644.1 TonB-dependent receptor [Gammaproteobacteria bacterium]